MLGRRLWLVVAVAMLMTSLAGTGSAHACSCAQLEPREAMRQADATVVAELVEVLPRGAVVADYRYQVQRVYESSRRLGRVVSVRSSIGGAACGLPDGVGRRYGLFLSWSEGRWRGGLCGVVEPRQLRAIASQRSRKRGPSHNCNS